MNKKQELEKLNKAMSTCSLCVLRTGCSRVVTGAGNPEAKIIFIGEAPGKKEAELGIPFVELLENSLTTCLVLSS